MNFFINNIIIFLVIIFFNNCASRGYPPGGEADNSPPQVVEIYPPKNSINISNTQSIQIIFDELLDPQFVPLAIKVEPSQNISIKCSRNKIIINPINYWLDGNFKITVTRNLSDYSLARNSLLKPIELLYSTSNKLYSKTYNGSIINSDNDKYYEIAMIDNNGNIISQTQSNYENNFSLTLLNEIGENCFFIAIENTPFENKTSEDLKNNIRKNKYAISSKYVNNEKQNLYLSDPIYRNSINSINLVNNNFGHIMVSDGTKLPFILNNKFFSGLISQINDFYYYNYNFIDSLLIKVDLENTIERYSAELKTMFKNNIIDTISPLLSDHYSYNADYILHFNEPVIINGNKNFINFDNKNSIKYKYISPLEVQLSDTNFRSIQIDCNLITDLNNNYICDSILVIEKKYSQYEQHFDMLGEINGTINYNGEKNIIVEVINLENKDSYRTLLLDDTFVFDKLPAGNYKIWAYEHLNKINKNYFSGKIIPVELSAKFTVYEKDVAVRANWKNTINLEIK